MALSGDVDNTGIAAATTLRGMWDLGSIGRTFVTAGAEQQAAAVGYAWGTRGVRFLSFSARLTPWSLGLSALQLGGESLYNYFNLDDQQRRMLNCCWGVENKNWDMTTHSQILAGANILCYITSIFRQQRAIKGDSSTNLRPPLKWAEIKPENLHV
jgi:hypothetical protein